MQTLYCQNCGYNLTGLPENRCPECGQPFNPEKLARGDFGPPRISLRAALLWILGPIALMTAGVPFASERNGGWGLGLIGIGALLGLIGAVFVPLRLLKPRQKYPRTRWIKGGYLLAALALAVGVASTQFFIACCALVYGVCGR